MGKIRGMNQKCMIDLYDTKGKKRARERAGEHSKDCTCALDKHNRVQAFFDLLRSAEKYNKEEKDGNE